MSESETPANLESKAPTEQREYDFFYEVRRMEDNQFMLTGPLTNIYRISPTSRQENPNHKYAQIFNGKVVAVFTEDEILRTGRQLK